MYENSITETTKIFYRTVKLGNCKLLLIELPSVSKLVTLLRSHFFLTRTANNLAILKSQI